MQLERCSDPPCPECGCQRSELLDQQPRLGQLYAQRQCDACGTVWLQRCAEPPAESGEPASNGHDKPVVYYVLRCKFCNGRRVPTRSTRKSKAGVVRWHRCSDCKRWFKSYEQDY